MTGRMTSPQDLRFDVLPKIQDLRSDFHKNLKLVLNQPSKNGPSFIFHQSLNFIK